MIAQKEMIAYISVKHQNSKIPSYNKVKTLLFEGDNINQAAKKLRKLASMRYSPPLKKHSVLAWAVFSSPYDDAEMILCSKNWRKE